MNTIGTKELHTPRLLLRKIRESDSESLFACGCLGKSPEEARKLTQDMMQYNDDPTNFHWILEHRGRAIGRIKAWEVNPRDDYAQLGYEIGAEFRSQGLMTEAVRAVCAYLLTEVRCNRVYCIVRKSNLPSIRVCEKAGMICDGIMRQHFKQPDGSYVDVKIYSILASELS